MVIHDQRLGPFAWPISHEMLALCREIDRSVRACRTFRRSLISLCPGDGAFQSGFKAAIDPDAQVIVMHQLSLEQVGTFQKDDIHVAELVAKLGMARFESIRHLAFDNDLACIPKREYEGAEHLIKADGVTIELLSRTFTRTPSVRCIEPAVCADHQGAELSRVELLGEQPGNIAFAAAVNAAQRDQCAA